MAIAGVEQAETGSAPRSGGTRRNPHAENVRKLANSMLRYSLVAGGTTAVVALVVSGLLAGVPGLIGSLAGGGVALGSALGTLFIMRLTADLPPKVVRAVALNSYIVKVVALLVVVGALRFVESLHGMSLAFTTLAVVLVVSGAEIRAFQRTKIPVLVMPDDR